MTRRDPNAKPLDALDMAPEDVDAELRAAGIDPAAATAAVADAIDELAAKSSKGASRAGSADARGAKGGAGSSEIMPATGASEPPAQGSAPARPTDKPPRSARPPERKA